MRILIIVICLILVTGVVIAQQQAPTPCEEVRSILATNAADLATQVRTMSRENEALKAKLAEMEKKMGNHKESTDK